MATDLHHLPEMIPGIETASIDKRYRFSDLLYRALTAARTEYSHRSSLFKVVYTSAYFLRLGLLFVPALFYRWSLKSTTWVWAPLVWVVSTSRKGDYTLAERLDMINTAQTERFRRWYSGFVLIRTILPFVFAAPFQPMIVALQNTWGVKVVDFWLFTGEIKLWHVMRVFNAGITFALFFFVDKALHRIKHGHPFTDGLVHGVISTSTFIRSLFGVYLASKLLHILISSIDWAAIKWSLIIW